MLINKAFKLGARLQGLCLHLNLELESVEEK